MLYDPKWGYTPASKDWKSLDNLIAWLETKDPSEKYEYMDKRYCMLAQYLEAQGKTNVLVGTTVVMFADEGSRGRSIFGKILSFFMNKNGKKEHNLPGRFDAIARSADCWGSRNFGQALSFAKAVRANNTYELAR
jgi:hypothetical protein